MIKNKIRNLVGLIGLAFLTLPTNVTAQKMRTRGNHTFKYIKTVEGVDYYEEVYDGAKEYRAKVKLDSGSAIVENIVFSFPDCSSKEWNQWGYKSFKAVFDDESEASIFFKEIDKIDFFWNKKCYIDSLHIYLNNGKKAKAKGFYGSGVCDVMGKVWNEAFEKYGDFKKPIYFISSIDFLNSSADE